MPGPPPKPKDGSSSKSNDSKRLSCVSCRARKVRCDRLLPCVPCTRSGLTCVFPKPAPPRQRTGAKARSVEIQSRLSRLEGLVGAMGGEKALEQRRVAMEARKEGRGVMEATEGEGEDSVQGVIRGIGALGGEGEEVLKAEGGRWLSGDFWSNLSVEVDGLKELLNEPPELDDDEEEEDRDTVSSPASTGITERSGSTSSTNFLFQSGESQLIDLSPVYPYAALISNLFDIYFNRFDPTFKVLHKPTAYTLLSSSSCEERRVNPKGGQEALIFAIFYAAVTCCSAEEIYKQFGEEKSFLVKKYERATESALANADFLNSTKIATLQAFVIYLETNRCHTESRQPWTLFAMAVRIAYALDLHCDGALLKLTPYATEIRRRLFWSIVFLDLQGSEDRGSALLIMEHTFDTRMPLNINDEDLDPEQGILREEHQGCTQMTFSLICYESSRALQIVASTQPRRRTFVPIYTPSQEDRERRINDVSQKLHSRFIVHCNTSLPMDWFCSMVAQIIILKFFLFTHYPVFTKSSNIAEKPRTRPSQESILSSAISLLELQHRLENSGVSWAWLAKNFVQWHPLAVTLAILCGMPPEKSTSSSDSSPSTKSTKSPADKDTTVNTAALIQRAWAIIDVVFDVWAGRVADSKTGNLWMPVRKLLERARAVHNRPPPSRKSASLFSSSSLSPGSNTGSSAGLSTQAMRNIQTGPSSVSSGKKPASASGAPPSTQASNKQNVLAGIGSGIQGPSTTSNMNFANAGTGGAADLNNAELQRLGISNVPQPPRKTGTTAKTEAGAYTSGVSWNSGMWNPALGIGLAGVDGQGLYDASLAMALDPGFLSAGGASLGSGPAAGTAQGAQSGLAAQGNLGGVLDAGSGPGMAAGGMVIPPEGGGEGFMQGGPGMEGVQMMDTSSGWTEWERFMGGEFGTAMGY